MEELTQSRDKLRKSLRKLRKQLSKSIQAGEDKADVVKCFTKLELTTTILRKIDKKILESFNASDSEDFDGEGLNNEVKRIASYQEIYLSGKRQYEEYLKNKAETETESESESDSESELGNSSNYEKRLSEDSSGSSDNVEESKRGTRKKKASIHRGNANKKRNENSSHKHTKFVKPDETHDASGSKTSKKSTGKTNRKKVARGKEKYSENRKKFDSKRETDFSTDEEEILIGRKKKQKEKSFGRKNVTESSDEDYTEEEVLPKKTTKGNSNGRKFEAESEGERPRKKKPTKHRKRVSTKSSEDEDDDDDSDSEEARQSKKKHEKPPSSKRYSEDFSSEEERGKRKKNPKSRNQKYSESTSEDSNSDKYSSLKHGCRHRGEKRNVSDRESKLSKKVQVKDWSKHPEAISRFALGSDGFVGALYDTRTDQLSSTSIFSKFPPTKVTDIHETYTDVSENDEVSDRFHLLQIDPQQRISILADSSKISGHGKYLIQEKKAQSRTLFYSYQKAIEKLPGSLKEAKSYVNKRVLKNVEATHVIVEVVFGANCTVTLEQGNGNSSNQNSSLDEEINHLKSFLQSDSSGIGYRNRLSSSCSNSRIIIHSDVTTLGKSPESIQQAAEFLLKIPNLTEGNCKPLSYIMVPLSTFMDCYGIGRFSPVPLTMIDEKFISSLMECLQDIKKLRGEVSNTESKFNKYQKYFPDDLAKEIKKIASYLGKLENEIKEDLEVNLSEVRSSKANFRDLSKKIEKVKRSDSKIWHFKARLENLDVEKKINRVDNCLQNNITYICNNGDLKNEIKKSNYDAIVYYTSSQLENVNPEMSEEKFQFFLSLARDSEEKCQYFLVDFDILPNLECFFGEVTVEYYINGKLISSDYFQDFKNKASLSFAKLKNKGNIVAIKEKPATRTGLELICPNSATGNCPKDSLVWTCHTCKDLLEYGFDYYFYCSCGKAESAFFEFKCSSPNHGDNFISVDRSSSWKNELNKLKAPKEMNILILGQSGVGKSTWINSIVNYLQYDTLQEAEVGGVLCVIPAKFTVTYPTKEKIAKQIVKIGNDDANEIMSVGQSATQGPKTYNFLLPPNTAVRIIDTPGLGDTEGIDKDKENMKMILDHISHLKEIHGICILMKSNETRIDALFRFCIMELLTHLHKSSAKNLIFCFTNSRSSFYSPGDTAGVLEQLLSSCKIDNMIKLTQNTSFCLDNEAFRYLCTLKYPNIPHKDEDENIFSDSWKISVAETKRLFDQIKQLKPHQVQDTTTLCNARNRILNLMKPVADITETIQLNLAAIEDEEKKIKMSNESYEELAKKLRMPHIVLESEPLPYPRTVCTGKNCVQYYSMSATGATNIEYTTHCHEHCYLQNITPDQYPDEGLRKCWAMKPDQTTCRVCNCTWDYHMHITYTQIKVQQETIDKDIESQMLHKKTAKEQVEAHVKKLRETIQQYEKEQKTIIEICLKFGTFLKDNAIAPYNDGFRDYLNYLIKQEENKVKKTEVDNKLLENLKGMMKRYEEEVKILQEAMKNKNQSNLTPRDIENLEQDLYKLKLTGKQIKNHVEVALASNRKAQYYGEQPLPVRTRYHPVSYSTNRYMQKEKLAKEKMQKGFFNTLLSFFF